VVPTEDTPGKAGSRKAAVPSNTSLVGSPLLKKRSPLTPKGSGHQPCGSLATAVLSPVAGYAKRPLSTTAHYRPSESVVWAVAQAGTGSRLSRQTRTDIGAAASSVARQT
jgi:hypothetical protein